MDDKQRVALIRKGNQLFNEGKLTEAEKIFVATKYKDGLIRVGDYFYFEKRMPIFAFKYYKMANCKEKVNEIFQRMIFALHKFIKSDSDPKTEKEAPFKIKLEPKKIPPKLKILAEEILRNNEEKGE